CRHEWRTVQCTNASGRRRFGLSLTIHEDACRIISVVLVVLEVRRAEPSVRHDVSIHSVTIV
ncbi:hypothetical protein, partial [Mycobacterium tuberculosis]|uniref:hypothetical protein n=1 Tax=Mycobacterium tuberculosis TaxID=1773 RepID=UPI001BDF6F04